ncbi:MAG: FMN-binding protein [Endomicrobium sp.]|jgi:major membrane immunogen (membrane-anchored lipoprotein)|nr:FMN-binding protein [Endomicrobium sp.]
MIKKRAAAYAFAILFFLSVSKTVFGASAYKYADGIYKGLSGKDDRGAYGEVSITFNKGKISDCIFVTYQKDGKIKNEDYGKVNGEISNREYYDKAQLAVDAMEQYAQQLVEVQKLSKVDVIAGATVAHEQFLDAVEDAFRQAKKAK